MALILLDTSPMTVVVDQGVNRTVSRAISDVLELSPLPVHQWDLCTILCSAEVPPLVIARTLAIEEGSRFVRTAPDWWTLAAGSSPAVRQHPSARTPHPFPTSTTVGRLVIVRHLLATAGRATPGALSEKAGLLGLESRIIASTLTRWKDRVFLDNRDGTWSVVTQLLPSFADSLQDSSVAHRWHRGLVPFVTLTEPAQTLVRRELFRRSMTIPELLSHLADDHPDVREDHLWLYLTQHHIFFQFAAGRWHWVANNPAGTGREPHRTLEWSSERPFEVVHPVEDPDQRADRERVVFVTGKGSVYHWDLDCTALKAGQARAINDGYHLTPLESVSESHAMRAGRAGCSRCV